MLGAIVFASLTSCSDSPVAPHSIAATRDGASFAKLFWTEPIDLGLLDVGEGGPYQSYANALNDRDEVVGRSLAFVGPGAAIGLAFRWTPDRPNAETGEMTALRTPGGLIPRSSEALDINDKGVAVGWFVPPIGPWEFRAVMWPDSVGIVLEGAAAVAINNAGYVVIQAGSPTGPTGLSPVSLWVPDSPGATTGETHLIGNFLARAINDRGVIVGASGTYPVAWRPDAPGAVTGTLTQLVESPGIANDVNNKGEIVGQLSTGNAFLWQPTNPNATTGDVIELNPLLGATSAVATGINEKGEIAGRGSFPGFDGPQSWVWSPGAKPGSTGTVTILGLSIVVDEASLIGPDINDHGDVAHILHFHATLWRKQSPSGVPPPLSK